MVPVRRSGLPGPSAMVVGCVACSEMILGKRTLSVSVEDSARFGAEQREAADGRKYV